MTTEEYFDWNDLIGLMSNLLSETSPSQAMLRTVNSRAYYAARGIAADLLWIKHQFQSKNNRVLLNTFGKYYPMMHIELCKLWDSRILADYRKESCFTKSGARLNLEICKKVVQDLNLILNR